MSHFPCSHWLMRLNWYPWVGWKPAVGRGDVIPMATDGAFLHIAGPRPSASWGGEQVGWVFGQRVGEVGCRRVKGECGWCRAAPSKC